MNSKRKIRVAIAGAAGYTGGELIRLLLFHPDTEISYLLSRSNAGKKIATVHQDLAGDTDLSFCTAEEMKNGTQPDVIFLCLGHGESKKFLDETPLPSGVKVIDLANDFRLQANASFKERTFQYGLPEFNKKNIIGSDSVANPGCFATAIQLGLLPLAAKGLLKDIYTTGITGSTGAGQTLAATSHFSWRVNNIQAYKTLTHQHLGEIIRTLTDVQRDPGIEVHFVPWRGDFARGIFISSQFRCENSLDELYALYEEYYEPHPFTYVTRDPVFLKQVVNTNKCLIQIEKLGSHVVIHSVIDNLLKGASGQALQNMNLMFGLEEKTGLMLKGIGF
jgi:N-acetyl-gamma-glutamyl-phosphate reductase